MNSKMPIKLMMFVIYGKMFMIVSMRSLIEIDALIRRKILMMRKPRMIYVVLPMLSPRPANLTTRPKSVPKTMKQSKTFQP